MIEASKVCVIWEALEIAKHRLRAKGGVRMSTSAIVDFIVDEARREVPPEAASREEIVEAWLYQALTLLAEAHGVQPQPRFDA